MLQLIIYAYYILQNIITQIFIKTNYETVSVGCYTDKSALVAPEG